MSDEASPFAPIEEAARLMAGFPHPWFVSGGWAIDLFAGRVTREHEDREIAVLRRDQEALREHLAAWELCKSIWAAGGGEWVPWEPGEWLALPIFQVQAFRPRGDAEHGQTAKRDPSVETPEFEFFLTEVENGQWQFRRNLSFTRPLEEVIVRSPLGIPILAPEVQLLYKAKGHRPKDEHDFQVGLGAMDGARRAWLKAALELNHPNDPWIEALGTGPGPQLSK
jgi:hypothetical protein